MRQITKKIDGGEAKLIPSSKNSALRLAIVNIRGHYPKEGFVAVNRDKTEAIIIISGKISIEKDNKTFNLKTNDTIYFEPNEKYKINGKAKIFVAITPGDAPSTEIVKSNP